MRLLAKVLAEEDEVDAFCFEEVVVPFGLEERGLELLALWHEEEAPVSKDEVDASTTAGATFLWPQKIGDVNLLFRRLVQRHD